MPWARNSDLPEGVRSALPADAQTRFRQVANERLDAGASDESAIRQAWHVVKQGWRKNEEGEWVRKAADEDDFVKAEVAKVDADLGLVFGWAIVSKVDGEPYFDKQGDHIPEDSMLRAAADFMLRSRVAKDMHRGDQIGDVVFAFPLTSDVAKAMGIASKNTGLIVAIKPSPAVLAKYRSGEYTGFSIGGSRIKDEDADEDDGVEKHTPGGHEHDQETHGHSGSGGSDEKALHQEGFARGKADAENIKRKERELRNPSRMRAGRGPSPAQTAASFRRAKELSRRLAQGGPFAEGYYEGFYAEDTNKFDDEDADAA